MMKKQYSAPEMICHSLEWADVLTASLNSRTSGEGKTYNFNEWGVSSL